MLDAEARAGELYARHQGVGIAIAQLGSSHYLRLPASLNASFIVRDGPRCELLRCLVESRYRARTQLGSPIYYSVMINETDSQSSIHGSCIQLNALYVIVQ